MFYAKTFAKMLQNIFSRIEHGIFFSANVLQMFYFTCNTRASLSLTRLYGENYTQST